MSLSTRITLTVALVVSLFMAVDQVIQHFYVSHGFANLERREALELHRRARHAIDAEGTRLGALGSARWAELAAGQAALTDNELDVLVVTDATGQVLLHRVLDPVSHEPIELRQFPSKNLSSGHPLIAAGVDRGNGRVGPFLSGLMETDAGVLLACSTGWGAPGGQSGKVIAGRFLIREVLDELMADWEIHVDVWPLDSVPEDQVPEEMRASLAFLPTEMVVQEGEGERWVLGTLTSVLRKPTLLMRSHTTNRLTEMGLSGWRFSLLSTLAVALVILQSLLYLLRRIVLRPLAEVTAHAVEVSHNEDTAKPLELNRADEFGDLATELNRMLAKLAQSRSEVVGTARLAGMSEVATGVLHNVGNALTSVCVAMEQARKGIRRIPVEDLRQINEVLAQESGDLARFLTEDQRGLALPALLVALQKQLESEVASTRQELRGVEAGVDHMRELVAVQQSHAVKSKGVPEAICLAEEVDKAIKVCTSIGSQRVSVEITCTYEELPTTMLDRHKLQEVLVNLIRNAQQAVERGLARKKQVRVVTRRVEQGYFAIDVIDNGVGISRENLTRIFNHGFTTRTDGHGFGLHASANAASEMGGHLSVHSDGREKGARFSVVIPFIEPARRAA